MTAEQKYYANTFLVVNLTAIFYCEKARRYAFFGETLLDLKSGSYDEPYKFGGKITDQESGLMYFEDRYYNGDIFITPDRHWYLSPHQSNYVYCSNDPINRKDPTGKKDVVFNDYGTYSTTTNDNFWHNLWYGTRGVINGKDGNQRATFRFNNSKDADRFKLDATDPKHLSKIDEKFLPNNIENITNRGINPAENLGLVDKYKYIYNESMSGQSLDYCCTDFDWTTLYLVGGTAYDNFDAGNYVWGYALSKLGVPFDFVKGGSEYNGFWNGKKQNGEWNESQHWLKRITWSGDAAEDQRAIKRGYYHNRPIPQH